MITEATPALPAEDRLHALYLECLESAFRAGLRGKEAAKSAWASAHYLTSQHAADAPTKYVPDSSIEFIRTNLSANPAASCEASHVYRRYLEWCASAGESDPMGRNQLGRTLRYYFPDMQSITARRERGVVRIYPGIQMIE